MLLDVTMSSESSVRSWLVTLELAVYSVDVVIAAIDGEDAVRWAEEQPAAVRSTTRRCAVTAAGSCPRRRSRWPPWSPAALARSDWTTILGPVASQQEVAFPAGKLLRLAEAYWDGRMTLASLAKRLRNRRLASVPPVCPPGAAPAAVSSGHGRITRW